MAVEQLPSDKYQVAGQPTLAGAYANKYDVIGADYGEVRDEEDKVKAAGQFNAVICYSRRETCRLTLEALNGTTVATIVAAGQLASGILKLADGVTDAAWNIRDAKSGVTKGVSTVELDLIQQLDKL
jgi:hypothetical protein